MIASLHGTIESLGSDRAVINVNGVGFLVHMPTSTLSILGGTGSEVHLHTCLIVREDNISLYGFASPGEQELFQTLIGVSGLGPRLALATLSAMSVEQATMAIAGGNAAMLTVVPGIGKRVAERIIMELKDKIGAGLLSAPTAELAEENADVLSALTALGYSVAESSRAIVTLPSKSKLSLEDKVKLALQYFATK